MAQTDDAQEPGANLSTEHQREGDAKRPDDRLDQGRGGPKRGTESPRRRTKLTRPD